MQEESKSLTFTRESIFIHCIPMISYVFFDSLFSLITRNMLKLPFYQPLQCQNTSNQLRKSSSTAKAHMVSNLPGVIPALDT